MTVIGNSNYCDRIDNKVHHYRVSYNGLTYRFGFCELPDHWPEIVAPNTKHNPKMYIWVYISMGAISGVGTVKRSGFNNIKDTAQDVVERPDMFAGVPESILIPVFLALKVLHRDPRNIAHAYDSMKLSEQL